MKRKDGEAQKHSIGIADAQGLRYWAYCNGCSWKGQMRKSGVVASADGADHIREVSR